MIQWPLSHCSVSVQKPLPLSHASGAVLPPLLLPPLLLPELVRPWKRIA